MASPAIEPVIQTSRDDETSSRQRRDGPLLWTRFLFLGCRAHRDDPLAGKPYVHTRCSLKLYEPQRAATYQNLFIEESENMRRLDCTLI